jgi:hypothetical protein
VKTPAVETIGKTMNATATTFQTVARELSAAFIVATRRDGGEKFYKLADGVPAWIKAVPRAAHESVDGPDPRMPSDWIYSLASRAADFAADHESADDCRDDIHEFADGTVDIYTNALFAWAADHAANRELCDAAAAEYGQPADGFDGGAVERLFKMGQYLGAERAAYAIIAAIETEADSRGE